MLETFHFLRPEWLFALPLISLLLVLLLRRSKQNSGWEDVCDAELVQFQLAQQGKQVTKSFQLLHWTVPFLFLISIIALAGPTWEKKEQPVFQQGNALVIILDLSLSMNAKDIKPSRLERAKLKLIDILKQKKEGQTALIAFAGDAHTVSPLTIDNKTIISLLPALDSSIMPLQGSHLVDALNTAKQLFKNSGFAHGDILIITDGTEPNQQSKLEKSIKKLRQQGYHISVIGVGSQTGSPIPLPAQGGFVKDQSGQVVLSKLSAEPLKQLADIGYGQYHKLSLDESDFKALIDNKWDADKPAIEQDDRFEQWLDTGAYLTLLLIPFALLSFRRGLLSIILLVSLTSNLVIEPVYANEDSSRQWTAQFNKAWDQLWYTPNQRGDKAFKAKDYKKAADNFSNKNWKASAQYRAGEFEQALEQYAQSDDAQSLYNKGNTLANLQKFQDAAEAYEQAIKKQPEFDDAQHNLDYMKELIAQQKQQSQENSEKSQEKSDKQSENQQQEQKNSSDDASKGNESDTKDSEKNSSDESDSEGSESGNKKDQSNSEAHEQKAQNNEEQQEPDEPESGEAQSNEPKSPEDYQQQSAQEDESDQKPEQQVQAEQLTEDKNEDEQQGTDDTQNDVLSQLNQEEQQSLKQWLQRIPDNPGKLLKVKFRNNTLLRQRQTETETQYEGDPW
ncbi:MAG: VWA domain-containing protein [gamma proteobacterium symbiont of Bathyaustriella thionipta]|nr:VWA domain-containing protein [gamma proteobacterium symbiont of Bathyaustriella thionipta]MCU7948872.1 VWA domain-containing protein [gamma proteobacterium symbiont of Bathyaustriella thionipta]MCU7952374.1 VWA domain-containing protein [gamma proteobacterium symbiont of Bathyaustriella thionipta]MCU7955329.1 VWA domain-containing protein [gamma proteobacterium symbiont of Bathyaustriella thionipta]MCU7967687.1 VWA domain-containing protein [gamma proteobacterium symbiont of Bathyaustriella